MRFCDPDACFHCPLADKSNEASCIRQKSQLCVWLSTSQRRKARMALKKLSLDFFDEVDAPLSAFGISRHFTAAQ
jgi:hypothetical protein